MFQFKTLTEGILRTTGIVAPMVLTNLRRSIDIEIDHALECPRLKMYMTAVADIEPQIDPFIDSKTRHQTMLVVNMRT